MKRSTFTDDEFAKSSVYEWVDDELENDRMLSMEPRITMKDIRRRVKGLKIFFQTCLIEELSINTRNNKI